MRSGEFILPRSADFWTALKEPREAYLKPSPEPSTSGASA
jgi:hypothetical protein